jgi:hypothetical protein
VPSFGGGWGCDVGVEGRHGRLAGGWWRSAEGRESRLLGKAAAVGSLLGLGKSRGEIFVDGDGRMGMF